MPSPTFFDCPVCGADILTSPEKFRCIGSTARRRMNSHLRYHPDLMEEFKLRSDLSTLSSEHPHRTPKRERPIPLFYNRENPPDPPLRPPTREEKESGDTPRLLAYMEKSGQVRLRIGRRRTHEERSLLLDEAVEGL